VSFPQISQITLKFNLNETREPNKKKIEQAIS